MHQLPAIIAIILSTGGTIHQPPSEENDLESRIDSALQSATRFLLNAQSPDGAWRSQKYGCFRDDPALTPLVLSSLGPLADSDERVRQAVTRGVSYLVEMVTDDRALIPPKTAPAFPVYTAAMASWVVAIDSPTERHMRARQAWLDYLLDRRLSRELGWLPSDPQFGGWGYAPAIPRKAHPPESETPFDSNLSATLFGLAAIHFSEMPRDEQLYDDVRLFVERCQNYSADDTAGDPAYDDGGFYFSTTDAARNKAGIAGTDRTGRTRFHSYGSATADGLRALLLCGLSTDHPRIVAAQNWLSANFTAATNPGTFDADRKILQDATYYYYSWSVTHALMRLNVSEVQSPDRPVTWSRKLAEELLNRQQPDGSWTNQYTDAKEDDPLVATPFAIAALAICRAIMPAASLSNEPHQTIGQARTNQRRPRASSNRS